MTKWNTAFEAAENLICNAHGVRSLECRNMHRLTNIAAAVTAGAGLGGMMGGKDGAAIGAFAGLLLGAAYPELATAVRANQLHTSWA